VTALFPAAASGSVLTAERISQLRNAIFVDGAVDPIEVEQLFTILQAYGDEGPADWPVLFVDAMKIYLVDQVQPEGYVSPANAEWLLTRINADRCIARRTEFEALLAIMTWARSVPDSLTEFALGLLKDAIVEGDPRLVDASRVPGAGVSATDVEALRRILYAASGEGFGHVTRREAEALFAIAEGTAARANHPSFADLFARAVGNHLLSCGGRVAPEAAEALRRERWLDERQPLSGGIARFFSRALTCVISGDGFVDASGGWLADSAAQAVLDAKAGPTGELIDAEEALWLKEKILGMDRTIPAVRALTTFIWAEAGPVPASLHPVLDAVA
jgi:hypothetical protein